MGGYVMNWKVLSCVVACGIAALCPAPIRDRSSKPHALPIQTPEQVAAEQQYNGTVGVVGSVPQKTNEDGTGPAPIQSSSSAASIVAIANLPGNKELAATNLTKAQQELKLDNQGSRSPLMVLLAVLAFVGGLLYAGKTYLEKNGPAPKTFRPADRVR